MREAKELQLQARCFKRMWWVTRWQRRWQKERENKCELAETVLSVTALKLKRRAERRSVGNRKAMAMLKEKEEKEKKLSLRV